MGVGWHLKSISLNGTSYNHNVLPYSELSLRWCLPPYILRSSFTGSRVATGLTRHLPHVYLHFLFPPLPSPPTIQPLKPQPRSRRIIPVLGPRQLLMNEAVRSLTALIYECENEAHGSHSPNAAGGWPAPSSLGGRTMTSSAYDSFPLSH